MLHVGESTQARALPCGSTDSRRAGQSQYVYTCCTLPDLAKEAQRLLNKLQFHYIPKHGSWFNMVELELCVLPRQCLDQRLQWNNCSRKWQRGNRNAISNKPLSWLFCGRCTPKCIGFIRHLPCDNPCGGLLAKVSWERIQLGRARSPLQLLQSGVVVVFNINLSLGSANHRTNRHADDIQLQMFFGAFNARVMQGGEMLKVLQ